MATQNFVYPFDAEKVRELFAAVKLPVFDVEAAMAAQQKNVDAVIEANKLLVAGYQDFYKRQVALFEAGIADAKERMTALQGQALTTEHVEQNVETMRAAFEKATADARDLAGIAEKANAGAFEILKGRFEEAIAEFRTAAQKIAA